MPSGPGQPGGRLLCVCVCVGGGDFEILRFFSLCVGPLCLWTLRFYVFLPVCAAPVLESLKIKKKIPNMEKSRVWGFEMAVTQRKKMLAI